MSAKTPDEYVDYVKEICKGKTYVEITELLNKKFNLNKTVNQIKSLMNNRKITTGTGGHFKKGVPNPYNTGKKIPYKPRYNKGKPLLSERVNGDGTVLIKTSEKKWEIKSRYIYTKDIGPIPKGSRVVFLDNNKLNVVPENLIAISEREYIYMCVRQMFTEDREITLANLNITKLKLKIYDRSKKK